jgi:hypothetical protein
LNRGPTIHERQRKCRAYTSSLWICKYPGGVSSGGGGNNFSEREINRGGTADVTKFIYDFADVLEV